MDYCDTCKLDTNHGGYDFCPHETKSKLDKALLQIRAYEQRILECRVSSSTEVQKVLDSIEVVIADKRKCICGGVGLGVACEAGCPNHS